MRKPLTGQITRPADTTAYAAGDVVGTASSHIITFNALDPGAYDLNRGFITKAWLVDTGAPATLPSLELWLFNRAPAAQADNAAFAVTDAELLAGFIGVIPFSTSYIGLASGNHVQVSDFPAIEFELAPGDTNLYGILVVRNAYTPISGETFKAMLSVAD